MVADGLDLGELVRGDEDGPPTPTKIAQQLADLHDAGGVEAVRRLVEDQQLGVGQQRCGDAEALLHAEREPLDRLPVPAGQADLRDDRVHPLERQVTEPGERHEIGAGREPRDERRALDEGPDS